MKLRNLCRVALILVILASRGWPTVAAPASERRYLYVAQPGVRNYVEYGGIGLLVYDIDRGYVIDTATRKVGATLTGDQSGIGRRK